MIDVNEIARRDARNMKEVSALAKQFIVELNGEPPRLQVEEVLLSDDGKNWLVTVSYDQEIENPNQLQRTLGMLGRRVYKRIIIDRESSKILGMQNWSYTPQQTA